MFFWISVKTAKSYESEDDLRLKCTLCQKITEYHQNETKQIEPLENSYCKQDPSNKWCRFVVETSKQYINYSIYHPQTNYCVAASLCAKELSPDLSGSRCETCVFLATYLSHVPTDLRNEAFSSFCLTSRPYGMFLCGDIEDDGLDYFLRDMDKYKLPEHICVKQHFCKKKKQPKATPEPTPTAEPKEEL